MGAKRPHKKTHKKTGINGKKLLTARGKDDRIIDASHERRRIKRSTGEVSEWFKELVLKTSDSERGRGFESRSLRRDIIPAI